MSDTFEIDQMKLFNDVTAALAKQHPNIPADARTNAVIQGCNHICSAYKQTNEEFKESTGLTD